ncbi:hypothetical protein Cob_v006372 [Colletotrichum orbiculare MAFF 240422]|uniref:Uncharacterized protein n=1 Tax=Colletotrichum orbiculare (strain 104-T / ATCC 96160 / CBS 514.97 / LARS 414 / MAFF 240422) TaxID=1213857 RepID=A0A484FTN8_COLOR|nr:hypothetical protein Cob_v006372 [Colletotrichum orbiculare MAFF 240422]
MSAKSSNPRTYLVTANVYCRGMACELRLLKPDQGKRPTSCCSYSASFSQLQLTLKGVLPMDDSVRF